MGSIMASDEERPSDKWVAMFFILAITILFGMLMISMDKIHERERTPRDSVEVAP